MIQGALLGDFIKGPLRGDYGPGIERGIALHRSIDALSDSDWELTRLRSALPGELRRYSGIVIDVVFDFLLSQHWDDFHADSIDHFANSIYIVLSHQMDQYPAAARIFCQRLIEHDLLCQYGQWATIDRVLTSIGWRFRQDNPLRGGTATIEHAVEPLREAFMNFYPRAQYHAESFRRRPR